MVAIDSKPRRSVLLYDLSWRSYKRILDSIGDHHFRHTFQETTLEIFPSPTQTQEQIRCFLGWMVQTITLEANCWIMSTGCATLTDRAVGHGLEPGNSFFVRRSRPRGKRISDEARPDLAIDVEICRPQLNRIESYARLGVGEVWRRRSGKVEFFRTSSEGRFESVRRSALFPFLSNRDLEQFVNEMCETGEITAIRKFITWLRKQIKGSAQVHRKKES